MSGRATRTAELLLSCLRFENDMPVTLHFDTELRPTPYNEAIDDRHPVQFVFPPDKPHSSGPNQIWNAIAALPYCDDELEYARTQILVLRELLGSLCTAPDQNAYRLALVSAVTYLVTTENEDDDE